LFDMRNKSKYAVTCGASQIVGNDELRSNMT